MVVPDNESSSTNDGDDEGSPVNDHNNLPTPSPRPQDPDRETLENEDDGSGSVMNSVNLGVILGAIALALCSTL